MKKVLIFTSTEGHYSLGQAASTCLKQAGFDIKLKQLVAERSYQLYAPFYQYFPFLFKIPYRFSEKGKIQQAARLLSRKLFAQEILKTIKQYQPHLVLSTYLFANPTIEKYNEYQNRPIPFINIVANPWSVHSLEISPTANFNLVYDKKTAHLVKKIKAPHTKIVPTGWLVKDNFYKKINKNAVRQNLHFKNDIFTILICAGSEGTNMILKIIPSLLMLNKKVQIMVVCGANKRLYKAMLTFKKNAPKLAKTKIKNFKNLSSNLNIKPFAFIDKMPELISIADLVIGKAGPNLLFETVAMHKPFFAICHISGQEDSNLDLIRKKKLGYVEENLIKVVKLLRNIVAHPSNLNRFNKSLTKEAKYNKKSAEILIKIVSSLL